MRARTAVFSSQAAAKPSNFSTALRGIAGFRSGPDHLWNWAQMVLEGNVLVSSCTDFVVFFWVPHSVQDTIQMSCCWPMTLIHAGDTEKRQPGIPADEEIWRDGSRQHRAHEERMDE
jgi:hypothetical protein